MPFKVGIYVGEAPGDCLAMKRWAIEVQSNLGVRACADERRIGWLLPMQMTM